MIRVNLLPWRETRRRRLQQQFFIMLGVVIFFGAAIWFFVHTSLANRYEDQLGRNKYLEAEIVKLDKEIEDIKKLKEMTASLLARKKVVEDYRAALALQVELLDRQRPEYPRLRSERFAHALVAAGDPPLELGEAAVLEQVVELPQRVNPRYRQQGGGGGSGRPRPPPRPSHGSL